MRNLGEQSMISYRRQTQAWRQLAWSGRVALLGSMALVVAGCHRGERAGNARRVSPGTGDTADALPSVAAARTLAVLRARFAVRPSDPKANPLEHDSVVATAPLPL